MQLPQPHISIELSITPKALILKERVMRNSTAILATVALGAVLAIGSATASMAHGGGGGGGGFGGGHGGGFGGGGFHGGFGGGATPLIMGHGGGVGGGGFHGGFSGRAAPLIMGNDGGFGGGRNPGSRPLVMSNGGDRSFRMHDGFSGAHGFYGRRHFRGRDGFDDFEFGPVWWPGQYWAYNDNSAAYCAAVHPSYDPATGTYLGRHGVRYYCP